MGIGKKNSEQQKNLVALFSQRLPAHLLALGKAYQQLSDSETAAEGQATLRRQLQQLVSKAQASGLLDLGHDIKALRDKVSETPCLDSIAADYQKLIAALTAFNEQPIVDIQAYEEDSPHEIVLAMQNKATAQEVAEQLKYFGCYCHLHQTLTNVLQYSSAKKPDLILLDSALCASDDLAALSTLTREIPTIFFTDQDCVETRLFALRAGGQAFFTLPFEFSTLIETVDALVSHQEGTTPYRVLIVEDSKTQARVTKEQLESANIITQVLPHPFAINEALIEFQPDVILLDLYMPECSGSELASIIRQQENFVSIPIVFLSAEANRVKQLDALSLGGDDFLTKPIPKEHLISSVRSRAARSRALRAEMIQDSLTGLLNHTRVLEQLDLEIARAAREEETLTFVMIDIDHFKSVNDQYGHPVGDRVIRSLARLLKQRLRKSDSIGRYGGEEFAVILPKTSAPMALKLLNEIRESFSNIQHKSNHEPQIEFSCTFSAGIASCSTHAVDGLCQAADMALYAAKHSGRNQVITADDLTSEPCPEKKSSSGT